MPRRSLSFQASPGGLPVPVGGPVLSCLSSPGGLSCLVPVCLAPKGSWYPLAAPWNFFLGVEGFRLEWPGRGTRPRPRRPPAMASRAPCSTGASVLSVPLWRSPSCVPVYVCPERPPERSPPLSPVELLRRGTRLPGGGSYVSSLSCVSCVPASCFLIWFVSCPC